jgi:peptide deformylase
VPDVSEKVVRPARVVVEAADASLRVREIEGTGLLARALCHETDHLNGMLFVDRLRGLKKEMTWRKIERRRARGAW